MSRSNVSQPPKGKSDSLSSMGFLLHRAQARLRAGVVEAIEGSGLHSAQLAVLGALSDRGGMSQKRLGELAQIEKSSMVLLIDALEENGWVRRERDPNDRRAHMVQLTADGARRFAKLGPRLWNAQQTFLKPLSAGEVATLRELLTRLGGDVEE